MSNEFTIFSHWTIVVNRRFLFAMNEKKNLDNDHSFLILPDGSFNALG